jgi:hypothetical protein
VSIEIFITLLFSLTLSANFANELLLYKVSADFIASAILGALVNA